MNTFDAVSLGILWDRIVSIANEMVNSLVRTSFSSNVREAYDLSCVLLDGDGNSLGQGTYSVPTFTGTAAATVRHMLAKFPPNTLKPGDVLVTNDPWMGTGHLFDVNVMRPVFRNGRIVGYTLSISHLPDIGGAGFQAMTPEIYGEGLQLPIQKLVREGQPNEDLIEIIRTNVRSKDQVIGDLMANVTCTEVGARKMLEFMDEYNLDDLVSLSRAIREQTESAMRTELQKFPNGVWKNRVDIEGITDPITLQAEVRIDDGSVHIDFDGTSPAIRAAINVPWCYTRALATYSLKCLTIPSFPNNEGAVIPVDISVPEGCILNALPLRPTGARHTVGHYIVPLLFGALAKAMPDRVQADVAMVGTINLVGRHPDGRDFAGLYFLAGGFGALRHLDGASTVPAPTNMSSISSEIWEEMTGMTVESKKLLIDSGGSGRWRGGLGQEVIIRNDTDEIVTASCFGQRTDYPALGFYDGGNGALRKILINDAVVHPKGNYVLEPGDRIITREAGGGGFGSPSERPVESVLADVAKGFVSREAARAHYGVEIDPEVRTGRRVP